MCTYDGWSRIISCELFCARGVLVSSDPGRGRVPVFLTRAGSPHSPGTTGHEKLLDGCFAGMAMLLCWDGNVETRVCFEGHHGPRLRKYICTQVHVCRSSEKVTCRSPSHPLGVCSGLHEYIWKCVLLHCGPRVCVLGCTWFGQGYASKNITSFGCMFWVARKHFYTTACVSKCITDLSAVCSGLHTT